MSNFSDQITQIKTLIHSNSKPSKSMAYSTLLYLQETSTANPSLLQSIAENSPTLVSSILTDISVDDEEIAALALKCLGFMIYHPSLVSKISVDDANVILEVVANTVMVTKIKSVCNLGMWCVSMQQFGESILVGRFELVLRAVVHGLDNPAGSLSTTFEAIQAVMKLASQLSEKMRDSSHIWAPPIYRRLLSTDKKEKDMSERCFLKIKAVILPPSSVLSKVVVEDLKRELLNRMKHLLSLSKKVQTVQAWGWLIRLLGSQAMKSRHLVNEMLKIPEQTFSDHNPQVQIASLVAWEGLIDAFVHSSLLASKTNAATEDGFHQLLPFAGDGDQTKLSGVFKSVKLIMTPLVGIMSSKCDTSVRSSCLHTWCYLLHKLNCFVSHPMSIQLVLEPILEVVLQSGSDNKNLTFWNLCLDLLDDFVLAKSRRDEQVVYHSSTGTESWSLKQHPIKWSSWDVCQMNFFIRMLSVIISHIHTHKIDAGSRSSVCAAALRVFRSVLKGVQMEFKSISTNYNNIMLCLNTIMKFVKKFSEEAYSEGSNDKELRHTSRKFLEAILEELDPSFLDSPIHKVSLDCRYMETLPSNSGSICENVLGIKPVAYMDMVSPLVYIIVLYISEVIQSTSDTSGLELTLEGLHKLIKVMLFSHDPLEKLHITVGLLYEHKSFWCLHAWIVIARSLKDLIEGLKDLEIMKLESINRTMGHLLSYPFFICTSLTSDKVNSPVGFNVLGRGKPEFDVIEVWKSLFETLCALNRESSVGNSFIEELCLLLNDCLDQNISTSGPDAKLNSCPNYLDLQFHSFFANAVMIVLECNHSFAASMSSKKAKPDDDSQMSSQFDNSLGFTARYLKLSHAIMGQNPNAVFLETSRVFSALTHFVCGIHLRETILSVLQMIASPLLQNLSCDEMKAKTISDQLQHLWAEILNCLKRSQPPITFDSSFLKLQASLLQKTLDHSKPAISELTVSFWNSTFGEQIDLEYPETLLDVLDMLYRSKTIKLHKKSVHNLVKCSTPEAAAQRYKVTATHNWSSKRVALLGDAVNQSQHSEKPFSSTKRKRVELTEHQKDVRRAQQGRGMDCNGHGPGIRTYTNLDFCQGNDESQEESQDNADYALEMLRRVA